MKQDYREQKDFKDYYEEQRVGIRLMLFKWILMAGILLLFSRFWYLQVAEGQRYRTLSERNHFRLTQVLPLRGRIFDREGRELAGNRVSLNLYLDRERIGDPKNLMERVARIIRVDRKVLEKRLSRARTRPAFEPVLLQEDVKLPEAAFIEARRTEFHGLSIRTEAVRSYPEHELASHLLGYVGEASETDLKQDFRPDIRLGDVIGKAGIERFFESQLSGTRGFEKILVNSLGREIEVLETVKKPVNGKHLTLTLDLDLQKDLETAFAGRTGSAVFLDPSNGEVLGLTSQPSFEPNLFASRFSQESWSALISDPRHPLQNRAIQSAYPPGSTFKIVMALAALEEGVATESRTDTCLGSAILYGKRFHCHKKGGHGTINFNEALVHSCNVYFYRLGRDLGIERIALWARRLGLGTPTGIDLPHEESGLVPDPAWKREKRGKPWYPGETISVSIGQGALSLTPLQLARVVAAIANGGILYRPHVVRSPEGREGTVQEVKDLAKGKKINVDPRHLEFLKQALWGVVNDGGTGWRARIPNRDVAGKTGTTQVVRLSVGQDSKDLPLQLRSHSWFVGFAPLDRPRIAFAVFVEHGGHGGDSAAPIARAVLERFFDRQDRKDAEENVRTAHLD